MSANKKNPKAEEKTRTIAYKIRLVIDIEGEVEGQPPLVEDTGVWAYCDWAVNDIADRLKCDCSIVDVKGVELKEVDE